MYIKVNTSKQISKLISEGKAEGFNKELFDLLVKELVKNSCMYR